MGGISYPWAFIFSTISLHSFSNINFNLNCKGNWKIYWLLLLLLLLFYSKWKEEFSKSYLSLIWNKVFKNGPSEICGRHPLKNLKWYGLFITSIFLKAVFHKFHSVNSLILSLICESCFCWKKLIHSPLQSFCCFKCLRLKKVKQEKSLKKLDSIKCRAKFCNIFFARHFLCPAISEEMHAFL